MGEKNQLTDGIWTMTVQQHEHTNRGGTIWGTSQGWVEKKMIEMKERKKKESQIESKEELENRGIKKEEQC